MPSHAAGAELADEELATLRRFTRSPSVSAGEALRARIVLESTAGKGTSEIARRLGISRPTVICWRERYHSGGIEALRDAPRSGRPKVVDEAEILARTLEPPPRRLGVTHWSTRLLASELEIGDATVARCWRRFGLKPWRRETFKFSTDPELEAKVRDVVGLYLSPPEKAIVLCVDEKSQIQALDRTAPILPLRPGLPERQTHDYKRYGTTTLFAAFNILNGKVIGSCLPRHRGKEFAKFLNQVEKQVPPDLDVHIILDNYSTHKSATVQRWLKSRKHRHFYFHFTPTSSSWLNQVERFFALITERMIRRGTFRSVEELERAIYAWLANWNNKPQPFVWKATADVILDKVRRCKELAGTPH